MKVIAKNHYQKKEDNKKELKISNGSRIVFDQLRHDITGRVGLYGSGQAYDYAASGFAVLSPDLRGKVAEIYASEYETLDDIQINDLYGQIMLGWSRLA